MTKLKGKEKTESQCQGGNSFGCKHGPYRLWDTFSPTHDRGIPYFCRKCKTYMGCHKCCQIPQEIVCLRCHDWALDAGEAEHGKMMRRGNLPPELKAMIRDLGEKMGV